MLVAFCLMIRLAQATEVFITTDGSDRDGDGSEQRPWLTIAQALRELDGSAEDPLTIRLGSGTYSRSETGEQFPIRLESHCRIIGAGIGETILDAEGEGNGVRQAVILDSLINVHLEAFTITRGGDPNAEIGRDMNVLLGGGVKVAYSNAITLRRVRIENCVNNAGGGIYCGHSSRILFAECQFVRNEAKHWNSALRGGAGIFVKSVNDFEMSSCAILDNRIDDVAIWTGSGGIIDLCSDVRVIGSEISGNRLRGGYDGPNYAAGLAVGAANRLLICNNQFRDNRFTDSFGLGVTAGLGVALFVSGGTNVQIFDNTFIDNYIESIEYSGYSLYLVAEQFSFTRNLVVSGRPANTSALMLWPSWEEVGVIAQNNFMDDGIFLVGWEGAQGNGPPTINFGGGEGWGNNLQYLVGIRRVPIRHRYNAMWNYWGEDADPIHDPRVVNPAPDTAFFVEPFVHNPVQITEDICYSAFNQGYYQITGSDGDSIRGGLMLANLSPTEVDIGIRGTFINAIAFAPALLQTNLDYLETAFLAFYFIPDTFGIYRDTLELTINIDGEEELRRLPIEGRYLSNGVLDDSLPSVPFELWSRCYPNPFNSLTFIQFSVIRSEKVSLSIYDASGRRLIYRSLGDFNPGIHTVAFSGIELPTGIYLYSLGISPSARFGSFEILK
ncbi:MAG: DUF1565 domain-containing protein [Calditrichaeota bacterium]|nr:DUF1565 domain-containing protein [Calditrichota bacterium]